MTQPQYGQKLVTPAEVGRDDRIFRKTATGVELMMLVDDLGFSIKEGEHNMTYTGRTFQLDPSKVGEQLSGTEIGVDTWTIPLSGKVHKVVPIKDAEFG